jgi:hypothetical protein
MFELFKIFTLLLVCGNEHVGDGFICSNMQLQFVVFITKILLLSKPYNIINFK